MATAEKHLLQWLRDAHGMEEQAQTLFRAEASRIRSYPEFSEQVGQALQRSRRHAEQIESCIKRHGEGTSVVKDTIGSAVALGQGLSGFFVADEVIKADLAIYAFEHMKIGSYNILAAAAHEAGDMETEQVCRNIIGEERQLAEWLETQTPMLVERYVRRDEAGTTAKH